MYLATHTVFTNKNGVLQFLLRFSIIAFNLVFLLFIKKIIDDIVFIGF